MGEQVYQPWEEAIERTIVLADPWGEPTLRLGDLLSGARPEAPLAPTVSAPAPSECLNSAQTCQSFPIDIAAGSEEEPLRCRRWRRGGRADPHLACRARYD